MAINDMQTPLTANDIAGVAEAREALRYLPLAMASAETSTPEDKAANQALIAARVRGRFTGEAVIDPSDEHEPCERKDCEAVKAAMFALRDRLDNAIAARLNAEAEAIRAKRQAGRDAWAIGCCLTACAGMAGALVGSWLGAW